MRRLFGFMVVLAILLPVTCSGIGVVLVPDVLAATDVTFLWDYPNPPADLAGFKIYQSVRITQVRLAAAADGTVIEVNSTAGMATGDKIGIRLDSHKMHWSAVASVVDVDTLEIVDAIPALVSAGNNIYPAAYDVATRTVALSEVTPDGVTYEYMLPAVADGKWFWVMTAFDNNENESMHSNEVTGTLDSTAPGAPQSVRIKMMVKVEIEVQ